MKYLKAAGLVLCVFVVQMTLIDQLFHLDDTVEFLTAIAVMVLTVYLFNRFAPKRG